MPRVLAIAGSDSGGGAGIQADLKAIARCGAHGMTAITGITEQNTVEVAGAHAVAPEVIVGQVSAIARDIGVDAVKIGMLGSVETVEAVGSALDLLPGVHVVLDPVMISETGSQLLPRDAVQAVRDLIVPRATVVTPNLPEAAVLAGDERSTDAEALARSLLELGPGAVVVTGGHRDQATDVFYDGGEIVEIPGERHPDGAAHGSGCTHSSSLAAHLAMGFPPQEAARRARVIAGEAVRDGLRDIGAGAGPVNVLGLRPGADPAGARNGSGIIAGRS